MLSAGNYDDDVDAMMNDDDRFWRFTDESPVPSECGEPLHQHL